MSFKANAYPNLYLIGFPKCATTTLFSILGDHPEVFSPAYKKPDYFMAKSHEAALQSPKLTQSERVQMLEALSEPEPNQHFASQAYLQLYNASSRCKYRLDASHYSNFPKTAKEIYSVSPHSRIVAGLRNPIKRFISHHQMALRGGWTTLSLEGYLQQALQLEEARNEWRCIVRSPLSVGLYGEYLTSFVDQFGKENVICVLLDDLATDYQGVASRIYEELGVAHYEPTYRFRSAGGRYRNKLCERTENLALAHFFGGVRKLVPQQLRSHVRRLLRQGHESSKKDIDPEVIDRLRAFYAKDQTYLGNQLGIEMEHCSM